MSVKIVEGFGIKLRELSTSDRARISVTFPETRYYQLLNR